MNHYWYYLPRIFDLLPKQRFNGNLKKKITKYIYQLGS